jgi:adenine deaminase
MTYQEFLHHKAKFSSDLAAVAMGHKAADLIIKKGRLVNVHTGFIEESCDVLVSHGIIASVGNADDYPVGENTKVVHAQGKYILPGLIDSHMHVESSMVDLPSFAAGILPHGTTTICPDIHEMTNVFGLRAVELFHQSASDLPINVLTAMPVCVPSIPGMEDAGAVIDDADVKKAYEKNWVELQGEQMNFPGVIFGDSGVHAIGAEGLKAGKVMTGHYSSPDLAGGLNAFIASGMTACHESTSAGEALAKISRGMYVQQRYGSAWLDLPNLVPALLDNPDIDSRMFTMVTDDVTPLTIAEDGHLIRVLREAVRLGVPPVQAVQMVTLNAAQLLEKERWIGSVAPGRAADFLLVDNLSDFRVDSVYAGGIRVAGEGQMMIEIPSFDYPDWALDSVHIQTQKAEDFQIPVPSDLKSSENGQTVRSIRLIPGMVFTKEEMIEIVPQEGFLEADASRDLAKICMIYRHEKSVPEKDRRAMGFLQGLSLKENTAYASTVSHDCHNLLVIGNDNEAMALAANELKACGGGLVVVHKGKVQARMSLPFAGLMSLKSVFEAAKELHAVEKALIDAGCPHDSAEMTISLLGLIVLPELHLSNKGLVKMKDGAPPCFVSLFPARDEKTK